MSGIIDWIIEQLAKLISKIIPIDYKIIAAFLKMLISQLGGIKQAEQWMDSVVKEHKAGKNIKSKLQHVAGPR